MRAKTEAEFARMEAENSKEKAEEEAYNLGVAKTQATLKAQIPRVCKLYCFQVWNEALKQARVEASSDLWKVEKVYYPPTTMKPPLPAPRLRVLQRRLTLLGLRLLWP